MTDLRRVAAAYGGVGSGNQCNIRTPGHSDGDLGTSITLKAGAPDGVLVKCHNGDKADALAVKDMLRRDGFLPPREQVQRNRDVMAWDYHDAGGTVIYRKVRMALANGDKSYRFEHPDGRGGWGRGRGDARPVPYRLPDLVAASKDALIYMVEGEKQADKLAGWGLVATSSKDWRGYDFSGYVKDRTVAILPDNDDQGAKIAADAKAAVERAGGTAFLVELPGLPPKGDIMDWRGDCAELERLTDAAMRGTVETFPLDDVSDWSGIHVPARRWLLDGWLPVGEASLLTGAGAVGKSLVSQQLAATIAAGSAFMGVEVEQATTIYITCEDSREELQRRQAAIGSMLGARYPRGQFMAASWKGELDLELFAYDEERRLRPTPRFHKLRDTALQSGARFIVLDNTSHLFGGDENTKREVAAFVNLLNGLAAEIDGVVLLLGHPNKTGLNKPGEGDANQFGGSVAWENQVRSRLLLSSVGKDDPDARVLTNPKANYAAKGGSLAFRWHHGAFVRDDDLPDDQRAEIAANVMANADNAAFLACLAERNRQQRQVSEKPTAANYAPRQFEGMAESKGIGRDRLDRAMDRLFRIGAIERGFLYRDTTEGKDIHGLRAVPETSPETSRKVQPEGSGNPQKTTGNTQSIPTVINGAATGAAAPLPKDDLSRVVFPADDVGDPNTWGGDQ